VFAKNYEQDKIVSAYVELNNKTNKYTNVNYFFNIPTHVHNIYTFKSTKIHTKTLKKTCCYMFRSLFKTISSDASEEMDNSINYLDLTIYRNTNKIDLNMYREPIMQFTSNHPQEYKLAAFTYYINRMLTLPITEQAREKEWNKILTIAQNNGFPKHTIYNLEKKLVSKQNKRPILQEEQQTTQKEDKNRYIHLSQPLSKESN